MREPAAPLRILLADDHVTVRHGLRLLIDSQADMKVISEASDGNAAMQNALALKPDVVVMDISMPGMNGLAATRALKQQQPTIAIVTLTRHGDDAYRAGAAARRRVRVRAEAEPADRAAPGDPRRGGRRAVPSTPRSRRA